MPTRIEIVVPVYNAADDLLACVTGLFRTTSANEYGLTLIDDASTSAAVQEVLRRIASMAPVPVRIFRNEVNLGFVRTVNRGMAMVPGSDVVLLNSDTLTTPGWLQRIACCAASDPDIGTITPFSNNAEICSFPDICVNRRLSDLPAIDDIARALAARKPTYPDIPTAVGFCMFIRRGLLNAIGGFDAETFGRGYGEENDFCLRATMAGYRNVICDDAFVAHTGGQSFSHSTAQLKKENGQKLLARYPHYDELIQAFIRTDPLREIRRHAWRLLSPAASP